MANTIKGGKVSSARLLQVTRGSQVSNLGSVSKEVLAEVESVDVWLHRGQPILCLTATDEKALSKSKLVTRSIRAITPSGLMTPLASWATAKIEDESLTPLEAARAARRLQKKLRAWADCALQPAMLAKLHERNDEDLARILARASNSRGYRLHQSEKPELSIPLFEAAAAIDPTYGMPRYNAARVHALKGDTRACLEHLAMLRRMGRDQRKRLLNAKKDPAFRELWDRRALTIEPGPAGGTEEPRLRGRRLDLEVGSDSIMAGFETMGEYEPEPRRRPCGCGGGGWE